MSDPRDGVENSWGPGTLDEYAKLSGQRPVNVLDAVDIFIKRNVDTRYHGHLMDTDDNDGEFLKRLIIRACAANSLNVEAE